MKIAIVGKGLAGLGAAFYLSQKHHSITIYYDEEGASAAASGLMHGFVGESGLKSPNADLCFEEVVRLWENLGGEFFEKTSFIKECLTDEVKQNLLKYEEVEPISDTRVKITKACKVDVAHYLQKLESFLKRNGVQFIPKKIETISELEEYDRIIVCAGYGIKALLPEVKLKYLKGQALIFPNLKKHDTPLIAKGYLVPFKDKVIIGSTYELYFSSSLPDIYTAYNLMGPSITSFYKPYETITPIKAVSGIRVAHPHFATPQILLKKNKIAFITGMGSRGILYHAHLGKSIADHIDNLSLLPKIIEL